MEQADKIKSFLCEHQYCVSVQNIKYGCEVNIPTRLVMPCNGKALRIVYKIGKTSVRQRGWYVDNGQKVKDVSYSLPLYAAPAFIYYDIIRMCVNINYSHALVTFIDKNGEETDMESFVSNMDIPIEEERKNEFSEKSHQLGRLLLESYKENFQSETYENLSVAMGVSDGFYMLKGIFWEILGQ